MGTFNILGALAGGYADQAETRRKESFEADKDRRKQAVGLIGELLGRHDVDEGTKGWLTQKGMELINAPLGKRVKFDIMEAPTRPSRQATTGGGQMQVGGGQVESPEFGSVPTGAMSIPIPQTKIQDVPAPGDIFMRPEQMAQRDAAATTGRLKAFGVDPAQLSPRDRARAAGINLPSASLQSKAGMSNGQPVMAVFDPSTGQYMDSTTGQALHDFQPIGVIDETTVQDANSPTGWSKVYTDKNTRRETGRQPVPVPPQYAPRTYTGFMQVTQPDGTIVLQPVQRTSSVSIPAPPPSSTKGGEMPTAAPAARPQGAAPAPKTIGGRYDTNIKQQERALTNIDTNLTQLDGLIGQYKTAVANGNAKEALKYGVLMNSKANSLAVPYGKAMGEVGNFAQQEQDKYIKAFYAGFPVITLESALNLDTGIAEATLKQARDTLGVMRNTLNENSPQAALDRTRGGQRSVSNPSAPPKSAPAIGAIIKGHRFLGGDPANPQSWEKVN